MVGWHSRCPRDRKSDRLAITVQAWRAMPKCWKTFSTAVIGSPGSNATIAISSVYPTSACFGGRFRSIRSREPFPVQQTEALPNYVGMDGLPPNWVLSDRIVENHTDGMSRPEEFGSPCLTRVRWDRLAPETGRC